MRVGDGGRPFAQQHRPRGASSAVRIVETAIGVDYDPAGTARFGAEIPADEIRRVAELCSSEAGHAGRVHNVSDAVLAAHLACVDVKVGLADRATVVADKTADRARSGADHSSE